MMRRRSARVRHYRADALHERRSTLRVISVSAMCTAHYLNDSARPAGRCGARWRTAMTAPWRSSPAGSLSHRSRQNGLAPEYAFRIWSPLLERP